MPADTSFSITKDSIQVPYRTFLADSASGLALSLILMACYALPVLTEEPLRKDVVLGFGTEARVFIFVALFLLATPIGFTLNALSWLLLNQTVAAIEKWCSRRSAEKLYSVWSVAKSRQAECVQKAFGADEKNFTETGWFLAELLDAPQLAAFAPYTHVRGLSIFLRNIAMLLLAASAVSLYVGHRTAWAAITVAIVVVLASTALMLRWSNHGMIIAAFALATILAVTVALVPMCHPRFAWQAVMLAIAAVVLVGVIGLIGYYHYTLIMLHAYFAGCSVGVNLTGEHQAPTIEKPPRVIAFAKDILGEAWKKRQ